jgi:hypothetical protein
MIMPKVRINLSDDDFDANELSEQIDEALDEPAKPRERDRPKVPEHKLARDRASKEWGRELAKRQRQRVDKRDR